MKRLAALAVSAALAGCWQSGTGFYATVPTATPFHTGKVESLNSNGDHGRAILTLERGQYRLTNDDRADSDFGDNFALRFFRLAGAPSDSFAFEMRAGCKPGREACRPGAERYYGLVRVTPQGAEVKNPDCPKSGLRGARPDNYGTCYFSSRALLEKALLALARTAWKPDIVYRYD